MKNGGISRSSYTKERRRKSKKRRRRRRRKTKRWKTEEKLKGEIIVK